MNRSQTYRYVDTAKWMKTKHTITVGGEIRKMDINRDTDPAPNGQFSFTGLLTSQLTSTGTPAPSPTGCATSTTAPACIGSDFADFLLGFPANTKVQFGDTSTYFRNWGYVAYASDDWHMFPKFTLTYGIRYEAFTPPPTEIDGQIANLSGEFRFHTVGAMHYSGRHAIEGLQSGANLIPVLRPLQQLGAAYRDRLAASRKNVFRQSSDDGSRGLQQVLRRVVFEYARKRDGQSAALRDRKHLDGRYFQSQPSLDVWLSEFIRCACHGQTATNTVAVNPGYQVPYALIWNASIEYNLLRNTFIEVMYTGTRGVHLDELLGFSLANGSTTSTTQNASGFTYDTTGAFSNFNALQVRLQKRMTHGLLFMARYAPTPKSLDDASTIGGGGQTVIQNNADPRGDYGLSSFDMRHQFLGNFTYQLPFGDRQRFASRGWEKSVFGAFRVNATFTAHSGTPYTVRVFSKNPSCQNVPGVNSERADQITDPTIGDPTVLEWFNTAAFATPTGCTGDAPRNSVTGPGAFTINSGVSKTIQFGRDGLRRLDFSWNTTNLLNHVNYAGLSTVFGSSTFGQITGAGAMRSMQFTTRLNF